MFWDGNHVIFDAFLTNLVNSLLAVRQLILLGLNRPARIMIRDALELVELIIACAVDREIYTKFREYPEELSAAKRHHRKNLRAVTVRQVVNGYMELHLGAEVRAESEDYRRGTYEFLSTHAHNHPIAAAVTAHAWVGDDKVESSLLGRVGMDSEGLLHDAVYILFEFVSIFLVALEEFHGWDKKPSCDDEMGWRLLRRVFQRMATELNMDGTTNAEGDVS